MRDEPHTVKFPTAALWTCNCYFVARSHTAAAEVGTSGNMTSDSMQNRSGKMLRQRASLRKSSNPSKDSVAPNISPFGSYQSLQFIWIRMFVQEEE